MMLQAPSIFLHMPACPQSIIDPNGRGWLDREPTLDEQEVAAHLQRRPPSRLLHVGVGGSFLFREFGPIVVQGLTKDGGEAERAGELGYEAILCNKYDVDSYANQLLPPFDMIVDVNIRSYACCDTHFLQFMELMRESLTRNGRLLTSQLGLDYLVPTSLPELQRLCPKWIVHSRGNVVILTPRRPTWFSRLFRIAPAK
jgi:hypothetical protein